jgi:P-type E1-E2 ATPase
VSINLAHGAKQMAKKQVIVKRLPAIKNFGSMNVLCSDKTETLTDGRVSIRSALNVDGNESDHVLFPAYLNTATESGYINPIDAVIRMHQSVFHSKPSPYLFSTTMAITVVTILLPIHHLPICWVSSPYRLHFFWCWQSL